MTKPKGWLEAVLAHCILNYERTTNPYNQATSRILDVNEWFRAIDDEMSKPETRKIDDRPPSENTILNQVELDRLNGKS